jgi:hypothetical protein
MFTPSGKVLPRQLLMSSHAAFFITWGFRTSYRQLLLSKTTSREAEKPSRIQRRTKSPDRALIVPVALGWCKIG